MELTCYSYKYMVSCVSMCIICYQKGLHVLDIGPFVNERLKFSAAVRHCEISSGEKSVSYRFCVCCCCLELMLEYVLRLFTCKLHMQQVAVSNLRPETGHAIFLLRAYTDANSHYVDHVDTREKYQFIFTVRTCDTRK